MAELSGKRALITGASSGIGAAIARQLAALGADLVLTARRKDALEAVAATCPGVRVDNSAPPSGGAAGRAQGPTIEVVVGDLGLPGGASAVWTAATAGGTVDLLINNAGFGAFRPFAITEWARDAEMIQLNMTSLVELSKRFVEACGDRPGYLLNIASIGAYQSVPNMAIYGASKAFVRNFTEGLHDELRGSPASATCVCPGGTLTEFHAAAGAGDYGWLANASMMTAERVATIGIRAMLNRKRTVIPGFMNKLSCFAVRLVPRRLASWMAGRVMGKPKLALPPRTGAAA